MCCAVGTSITEDGSGSGDAELAISFFTGPQPCVVCEFEQYPCGDRCLNVFGLLLPECFERPGCAAGAARGSLFSLGDSALLQPNASNVKAALALERAATINPHFADPALFETLKRIQSVSKCTGVVCPAETQCLSASVCNAGNCAAQLPKSTGLQVRCYCRLLLKSPFLPVLLLVV